MICLLEQVVSTLIAKTKQLWHYYPRQMEDATHPKSHEHATRYNQSQTDCIYHRHLEPSFGVWWSWAVQVNEISSRTWTLQNDRQKNDVHSCRSRRWPDVARSRPGWLDVDCVQTQRENMSKMSADSENSMGRDWIHLCTGWAWVGPDPDKT